MLELSTFMESRSKEATVQSLSPQRLAEPERHYLWPLSRGFIVSAVVILAVTGVAKVLSSLGQVKALDQIDPVFGVPLRALIALTGIAEIFLAGHCFRSPRVRLSTGLLAWFFSLLLVYRISLLALGWRQPCSCLGNLTEVLDLSPDTADLIMKWVLAYLLVGSLGLLLLWRRPGGQKPHMYAPIFE